jgi:hypothetical protein
LVAQRWLGLDDKRSRLLRDHGRPGLIGDETHIPIPDAISLDSREIIFRRVGGVPPGVYRVSEDDEANYHQQHAEQDAI